MSTDSEASEVRSETVPAGPRGGRKTEVWRLAVVALAFLIVGVVVGLMMGDGGSRPVSLRPPPPFTESAAAEPAAPAETARNGAAGAESLAGADDAPGIESPEDADGAASPSGENTVAYRDGRFWPDRLDIDLGDAVVFVNDSDQPVWPASNIHPTHAILPEFDPRGVIRPGEAWRHTFTRSGYWRYHNHLEPSEVGMVVAIGASEDVEPLPAVLDPLSFPSAPAGTADELGLLRDDDALARFVEAHGPGQATRLLSAAQAESGWDCHDRAHEVGRLAYEIHGPAAVLSAPHECQSGAMHGALEALFAHRGTAHLANDVSSLCSAFGDRFDRHNCMHGIGHGLMAWTSYELHEALDLCDQVHNDSDAASCLSGVFMENVVGGLSGLMGHTTEYLDLDDPVYPCDAVAEQYVDDCYFFQTSHMVVVLDWDFAKVSELCDAAPPAARLVCFASMGRDVSAHVGMDPAAGVALCGRAPQGPPRVECLAGAMQDAFWSPEGAPTAAEFCGLLEPGSAASERCYAVLLDRAASVLHDPDQRAGLCALMPAGGWRHRCEERLSVSAA
ncbi:MAG: hypothetical protein F4017_03515 [Acidimicrobiaceae bacterium]|nr:hypothetical protein [Acidimicrobiaceae bacterium]MYK73651.1 hypothetical protein [Acidimicrobiaceae bacterium]